HRSQMTSAETDPTTAPEPVLKITDQARQKVLELRADEQDPDTLALWLEVNGVAGGSYTYDMYFQAIADAGTDDAVQRHDDLSVVIPASSLDRVRGSTLDLSRGPQGGMVIINPNSPAPAAAPPSASPAVGGTPPPAADLSGYVAQRVMQVLESHINPSIASHGGQAELV